MCGIVGYIGHPSASKTLVTLLKNLEYRGYDSSGIAIKELNEIRITKAEGKIANLERMIVADNSTMGIAHTRWATHGKPTVINAHPHASNNSTWTVVHNGIIENYEQLKKEIEESCAINFKSETDTEVIPQLLEYMNIPNNPMLTLIKVCNRLKGSYALACMSTFTNSIMLAKQKSPLYIAQNNDEIIVASDPICFAGKVEKYYSLSDNEFCEASKNGIVFYNSQSEIINKVSIRLDDFEINLGKQKYDHFMLKEICEIPDVLNRVAKVYSERNILQKFDSDFLQRFNKIILVGCGTAYHASMMGARYIERISRFPAQAFIASEFRYSNPIIDEHTLAIFVSQSGETADTLGAEELASSMGATTVALTNVLYSTLAKKVDIILPVCAGHEIAVASTKAYNAQVAVMYMLAKQLENVLHHKNTHYIQNIRDLADKLNIPQGDILKEFSSTLIDEHMAFFIGRDFDYISSEEASLKLKEITYINSSAYPSGELKHGFLALIEKGTPLFVIATESGLLDKTLNGAHEAYTRGATITLITQLDIPKEKTGFISNIINLPQFDEELMPIISVIPFQLISYYTSVSKGINPDQPRNLAKSVTVE